MLNRISQTENDKYFMISFTCGIKKKSNAQKQSRKVVFRNAGNKERLIKGIDFQLQEEKSLKI